MPDARGAASLRRTDGSPVIRRLVLRCLAAAALLLAGVAAASAAPADAPDSTLAPPAPSGLEFFDVPKDLGGAIDLHWRLAPGDTGPGGPVTGYVLLRAPEVGGPWVAIDSVGAGVDSLRDTRVRAGRAYFYRIAASGPGGRTLAGAAAGPAVPRVDWLRVGLAGAGLVVIVTLALVVIGVVRARRNAGAANGDGPRGA